MQFRSLFILAAACIAGNAAYAQGHMPGKLRIERQYARPTVPNQRAGAAYLTIENKGKTADKLVAISSPIAKSVEMHTMSMDGDVMKMREVQDVEVGPASKVDMTPGHGYHLMLMGLSKPLKVGDRFPMTLTFEKAGKTVISVPVRNQDDADSGTRH